MKLRAAGDSGDFITIQGAQHRIRDWDHFQPGWANEVADWLGDKLKR